MGRLRRGRAQRARRLLGADPVPDLEPLALHRAELRHRRHVPAAPGRSPGAGTEALAPCHLLPVLPAHGGRDAPRRLRHELHARALRAVELPLPLARHPLRPGDLPDRRGPLRGVPRRDRRRAAAPGEPRRPGARRRPAGESGPVVLDPGGAAELRPAHGPRRAGQPPGVLLPVDRRRPRGAVPVGHVVLRKGLSRVAGPDPLPDQGAAGRRRGLDRALAGLRAGCHGAAALRRGARCPDRGDGEPAALRPRRGDLEAARRPGGADPDPQRARGRRGRGGVGRRPAAPGVGHGGAVRGSDGGPHLGDLQDARRAAPRRPGAGGALARAGGLGGSRQRPAAPRRRGRVAAPRRADAGPRALRARRGARPQRRRRAREAAEPRARCGGAGGTAVFSTPGAPSGREVP